MPLYSFSLGRKSLLSIAEIAQTLPFSEGDEIVDLQKDALICQLQHLLPNPQESLNALGGIIKIVEIFSKPPKDKKLLITEITNYLAKKFEHRTGKLSYGISVHSFTHSDEHLLKSILKKVKIELEGKNVKNRFINHNFKNLQNAAIKGEKLLQKGAEIVIIEAKNKYYIGETKALQDFENYSHRDYDRPARDPRLGMLPPKVAQMMINFTGLTRLNNSTSQSMGIGMPMQKLTLFDPFCGIGTVLSEALLKGFNIIGSDINADIIKKSRQNIDWLIKETPKLQRENPQIRLFNKDAGRLSHDDQLQNVDCIVTESYLGPPVSQLPSENARNQTFEQITNLSLSFFKAVYPLLKKGTPIVISFPFYRSQNKFFFIENLPEQIAQHGYTIEPLIPNEVKETLDLNTSERESLLYDRPDQVVGREIWKFVKD